jgi:hypothetical protein
MDSIESSRSRKQIPKSELRAKIVGDETQKER